VFSSLRLASAFGGDFIVVSAIMLPSMDDAVNLISDGLVMVVEGCKLPVKMRFSDEWPKAEVLSIRCLNDITQYYVHFVDYNKRLDEWVTEDRLDTRRIEPPTAKEDKLHSVATGGGLSTPKKAASMPLPPPLSVSLSSTTTNTVSAAAVMANASSRPPSPVESKRNLLS
jgi:histone acetyltransferase HTATIP